MLLLHLGEDSAIACLDEAKVLCLLGVHPQEFFREVEWAEVGVFAWACLHGFYRVM